MRLSRYPINTSKETPSEAEVISHQLMLRAGLIRRLAAGIYTFLPMGLRAVRKAEAIIREEMNSAGALEVLMPAVQPAELWQESKRWEQYGPELLRLKDRHDRDFVIGPTHEEVITDIARRELKSYRQLPVNFYQIQMKFRDEIRPRFGVMRGREFLMKDAYSFHADQASLAAGYAAMKTAYTRIFERMGLEFRAVRADTGAIGGSASEEFQVLADSGEDAIAVSDADDYAANLELASTPVFDGKRPLAGSAMERVATPDSKTMDAITKLLGVPAARCAKTLIVDGADGGVVALVLRGDHELNTVKAQKVAGVASPLRMASPKRVLEATGVEPGFIGPVGLKVRVVVDHAAAALADFVCGANEKDAHLTGVNWGRDLPEPETADLRNVVAGDPSPSGTGKLVIRRGIEVGHIFQLGRKYSEAMQATVLDAAGKPLTPLMGCYGIGVTRVVAAAIEQNHDDKGIIWPEPLAPYTVLILTLNHDRSQAVRNCGDRLYGEFEAAGIDALYDDRDARPGVKFADAELLGIPHCIVVGDRGLAAGRLEYRNRRDSSTGEIAIDGVVADIKARLGASLARLAALLLAVAPGVLPAQQAQREPELRAIVQQANDSAPCFADRFDSAVWFKLQEPRLRSLVKDPDERMQILETAYCEAIRPNEQRLPPGLIMAVMDVESRFDRWAVSGAGAVGLMQVMPFWPDRLGMKRHELTQIKANMRMGCAILRFYMKRDQNDVRKALARYNGSVGNRKYPDQVVTRWTTRWTGADDLGTAGATVKR